MDTTTSNRLEQNPTHPAMEAPIELEATAGQAFLSPNHHPIQREADAGARPEFTSVQIIEVPAAKKPLPQPPLSFSASLPSSSGELVATLCEPHVALRILEWFFALIAFSALADAVNKSYLVYSTLGEFNLFTGITGWLWTFFFIGSYVFRARYVDSKTWKVLELGVSAIWTIFFFSVAVAVASGIGGCERRFGRRYCSREKASLAFQFLSFFAWAASTYLAFRMYRRHY
ncbi:hypothetical protein HDU85_002049 [Gaertneriomyces sp. JEL0708]|nr:hypothetical protein HDU85_002049 [Gaertneriomyces sp. JEL0708]